MNGINRYSLWVSDIYSISYCDSRRCLGWGGILWTIIVVLVVLWLLGFLAFHIAGGLIHILIVIALILLIVNLLRGRGARL